MSGVVNEIGLNFGLLGLGVVPASEATAPDTTSASGRTYTLEVRSQAGAWLCNLQRWRNGKRTQRANEYGTVTVEVPGDDEAVEHLVFPNEVWVYLGDYESVVGKYTVVVREEQRSAGHWVHIECSGLLSQLSRELVTTYETPVTTDTETGEPVRAKARVKNIVGALLAEHQTQSPAIGLGKIDGSVGDVEVAIRFDNKSVLACLQELHRICGGYFYADTNRKLHWRRNTGYSAGHWIKFGHNLTGIRVRTDYRQIQTRLIGFGAGGTPETRLQSTANDSTAQSAYGVIRSATYADTVNEQETLDELTEAELARVSGPKTTYEVGVVNLAALNPGDYSFEAGLLHVGTRVGLYVDAPEVSMTTTVLGITWDLDHPARVEVELSDPEASPDAFGAADGSNSAGAKTLFDYIADALEEEKAGAGVAMAVGRLLDPSTEDLGKILTVDNATDRLGEELEEGVTTELPEAEDADRFVNALAARLIDLLGDTNHPLNSALRAAVGAGSSGESNIWVPYDGS